MANVNNPSFKYRFIEIHDIPLIVKAFQNVDWNKSHLLFNRYLQEQKSGERVVWLACVDEEIAGYVTLKWNSLYQPFQAKGIPEIMDLNVLPSFRQKGVGNILLELAEQEASSKSKSVGIGVGLYAGKDGGYGAAQRLYVKRGFIPDGNGVTYNYQPTIPGSNYILDDDLILWFTKTLTRQP